jgi:hypothetical protein
VTEAYANGEALALKVMFWFLKKYWMCPLLSRTFKSKVLVGFSFLGLITSLMINLNLPPVKS